MRAKAIAAVLALGLALLLLPTAASAKPGFYKRPGHVDTTGFISGPGGYSVVVSEFGHQALLFAERSVGRDGEESVVYARRVRRGTGDRLHLDLGQAGEVDVRFVPEEEEPEPVPGCVGAPSTTAKGHFVGTISFHPPGGFVDINVRRMEAVVTRTPPQICRGHGPRTDRRLMDGVRRLVAGTGDGDRRFEATSFGIARNGIPAPTVFAARASRRAGKLSIVDSASKFSANEDEPFRVPSLDGLPATTTVEPGAPFTGSATFDLPSPKTATLTGDLAAELPEVGEVPLTGPNLAAGLCRGSSCTKSLPKALRAGQATSGAYVIGPIETQSIR